MANQYMVAEAEAEATTVVVVEVMFHTFQQELVVHHSSLAIMDVMLLLLQVLIPDNLIITQVKGLQVQ
jgi:hypothetical protein